jgi:hypothetical protein
MGLFDKAKAYMTGSHAKVTIEFPQLGFPGQPIAVKVTAQATMNFEFGSIIVDAYGDEDVEVKNPNGNDMIKASHTTYQQEFKIAGAGSMQKDQEQTWTGTIVLPPGTPPTYRGKGATHIFYLRGRLETKGNDPDSGYKEIRIGQMG